MKASQNKSVDDYIAEFPPPTQKKLRQMRSIIRKNAPGAEERISYRMPAYYLNGWIAYFAGYDRHIGLYPLPHAIEKFKTELARYKHAKGSIQFPLDEPLPVKLIGKIIKFRVKEIRAKGRK